MVEEKKTMKTKLLILTFALLAFTNLFSKTTGTIRGKVVDEETQEPLLGVNVTLMNTQKGAATDEAGKFSIQNVPIGSYNLIFQYIGYKKMVRSDVIVRPDRITYVNAGLFSSFVEGEEVVVKAGFFQKEESEPISVANFNAEEVRRSPGSAGDVSRILGALPSAARVTDTVNDLMVRGGSPMENAFYIDNIQIPNINHYPTIGATGGPIGVLNVDFIDDVNFYAGGFSAAYGDRLSSVVDIKFREGNREKVETQLDMSMMGFGGIIEGPLARDKGSWFMSVRRSYLDILVKILGEGTAPRYGDVQGKVAYDLNSQHKLTFINIFANNYINEDWDTSLEEKDPDYGHYRGRQNTVGMNWRWLWSDNGYSNTSVSYALQTSDSKWFYTKTKLLKNSFDSFDGSFTVRNMNYLKFNKYNKIEFGLNLLHDQFDYQFVIAGDTVEFISDDKIEILIKDELHMDTDLTVTKSGAYFNYIWTPCEKFATTLGVRGDYFSFNKSLEISPRFSATYKVNNLLSFNAGVGLFYQNLPYILLAQADNAKDLETPQATHYILGMDYMLTADTKLTIEAYSKEYQDFPLTHDDPTAFVVDDGMFERGFRSYDLVGGGVARTRGLELLIQKKLAVDFYGIISGAMFHSEYKDLLGKWRDRAYDNQYLFSVIGGYKPNNKWEFSVRWNYAGGVPYTPLDVESLSTDAPEKVYTEQTNSQRYPDYHSLNVRFDRRFHFESSSLIVYLSLWNAYNRKNVSYYYWNEVENKQVTEYQWGFMPIGGLEYEF